MFYLLCSFLLANKDEAICGACVLYCTPRSSEKNLVFNYRNSLQHKFYSTRLIYNPFSFVAFIVMAHVVSVFHCTNPFSETDFIYFISKLKRKIKTSFSLLLFSDFLPLLYLFFCLHFL